MRTVLMTFAIGLVYVLAACSMTYYDIVIPGGDSDDQKLATAEAISNELLDGPLGHYVMQSVPGVSVADLETGLALQWERRTFTGAKSGSEVLIRCKYESNRRDERVAQIVAACEGLVSEAVKKRFEGKTAA